MFKKTYVAPFSKPAQSVSNDTLYWKKFAAPIFLKEVNLIDYIDISPVEPHFVAVTCSSRVQLYHPITRMIHKNYNRFKEAAYGAVFRKDGRLLLAGSEENSLKLFDVSSKNLLRVFKGHQRAVHRCAFLPLDNEIVSFSDDKTVIQWDLASEAQLHKFEGHADYVRCGQGVESNPNLILSGSYDHTVKMWDKREKTEVLSVNHGGPVESVLISPSGSLLYTAGLTEIKVWDCLSGGRLLSKISQHHKTITSIKFAKGGKQLLSSSLDRHVKVYDVTNYEVLHTYDYSSPILSLGISPDDKTIAVGMTDGILALSRKEEISVEEEHEAAIQKVQQKRRKSQNFVDYTVTDSGIREEELTKDKKYDTFLRKFRYKRALDEVLSDFYCNRNPEVTVAVLQELIRRDGLMKAIKDREGKPLIRLLKFLVINLRKARFMRILIHVANAVVDVNASRVGQDPVVDQLFLLLCEEVNKEAAFMTELFEIKGCLDMILNGAKGNREAATLSSSRMEPSQSATEALVVNVRDR